MKNFRYLRLYILVIFFFAGCGKNEDKAALLALADRVESYLLGDRISVQSIYEDYSSVPPVSKRFFEGIREYYAGSGEGMIEVSVHPKESIYIDSYQSGFWDDGALYIMPKWEVVEGFLEVNDEGGRRIFRAAFSDRSGMDMLLSADERYVLDSDLLHTWDFSIHALGVAAERGEESKVKYFLEYEINGKIIEHYGIVDLNRGVNLKVQASEFLQINLSAKGTFVPCNVVLAKDFSHERMNFILNEDILEMENSKTFKFEAED